MYLTRSLHHGNSRHLQATSAEDPPLAPLHDVTAQTLALRATKVFQPRTPINTRDLFAGRWDQITSVVDAVSQTGLHIVIFGERGVGKSSLSNIIGPLVYVMEDGTIHSSSNPRIVVKVNVNQADAFEDVWRRVFEELSWIDSKPVMGFTGETKTVRITLKEAFSLSDTPSIDEIRRTLMALPRSIIIFDEFDRGSEALRTSFTDLIKALSDYAIDSTIILVGVSETVDQLIQSHASIVRAIVQVNLKRMSEQELRDILTKGENALEIKFSEQATDWIVRLSQGLPHYTHLIGLHATREALGRKSRNVEARDVQSSFDKAVSQAEGGLQEKYLKATRSAYQDALYEKVLLACAATAARAPDPLGWFHTRDVREPFSVIVDKSSAIANYLRHMYEFLTPERGSILERSGNPRSYLYRFREPLMPPFIFMASVKDGIIDFEKLKKITSSI